MAKKYSKLSLTLKKLLFDRGMKPIDLARELNIPQPTIHRIVNGKSSRPYKSSLEPIADYFSLSVEQLIGEENFVEGSRFSKAELTKKKLQSIPLITWKAAFKLENMSKFDKNEIKDDIIVSNDINEKSFALLMPDTSMEPSFPRGSVLIFDPTIISRDRTFILVKLDDTNLLVIRQLLLDMEHKYLRPLNPDLNNFKMRVLNKEDKILACLVEVRMNCRPDTVEELIGE